MASLPLRSTSNASTSGTTSDKRSDSRALERQALRLFIQQKLADDRLPKSPWSSAPKSAPSHSRRSCWPPHLDPLVRPPPFIPHVGRPVDAPGRRYEVPGSNALRGSSKQLPRVAVLVEDDIAGPDLVREYLGAGVPRLGASTLGLAFGSARRHARYRAQTAAIMPGPPRPARHRPRGPRARSEAPSPGPDRRGCGRPAPRVRPRAALPRARGP
jgi:hypothetical protein